MNKAILKIAIPLLVLMHSPWSSATVGYRTAVVDLTQTDSATRVGYENLMYVQQVGLWTGSPACHASWAYFDAKLNPHFVAIILSARLTEKPVQVVVDDTLPKLGGFCQIVNVQI